MLSLDEQQKSDGKWFCLVLAEVQRILNNCSLLPVFSGDLYLWPRLLTLLALRSNTCFVEPIEIREIYLCGWKPANYLTKVFCREWLQTFIFILQARRTWVLGRRPFNSGDVVVVVDEQAHVGFWLVYVVRQVIFSSEGLVWTVNVRKGKGTLTRNAR